MNILISIDKNYIDQGRIMLLSILKHNLSEKIEVYLMHSKLADNEINQITDGLCSSRIKLHPVQINDENISGFPITNRYPTEIYYRIFAAQFLPDHLERILYLDPDLIVRGSLAELYNLDMGDLFYAAASHVQKPLQTLNKIRLSMEESGPYINSGVLLMNLKTLRKEQDINEVFEYVKRKKMSLILPDQDIISGLYPNKIIEINTYIYNMTEKLLMQHKLSNRSIDLEWVEKNSIIIHYCGKNKPWRYDYIGQLDRYYHQMLGYMEGILTHTSLNI